MTHLYANARSEEQPHPPPRVELTDNDRARDYPKNRVRSRVYQPDSQGILQL